MEKAQAWGIDLVVGMTIFIFGVVIFYFFALNYSPESSTLLDDLHYDGDLIASSLLTEGYPIAWNQSNVQFIGILSSNKVNATKLERFYNLSMEDYNMSRALFNVRYNYYLNFSDPMIINGQEMPYIGLFSSNPNNLLKVSRITIYNNKPATLQVYVWN